MNGLLLSERIGRAALNGSHIKIIIPESEVSSAKSEYKNLVQFPSIKISSSKNMNLKYVPTFYTNGNECGFMSMPFEFILYSKPITVALHIKDKSVAQKLENHFNRIWNTTKPFVF